MYAAVPELRMSFCTIRDCGLVPDSGNTGKSAWCTFKSSSHLRVVCAAFVYELEFSEILCP